MSSDTKTKKSRRKLNLSDPYHRVMVAIGPIGGDAGCSRKALRVEDVVDPPESVELTESIAVPPAAFPKAVCQRAFQTVVDVGGRRVVEIPADDYRIGRPLYLTSDIIRLKGTLPVVVRQLPHQVFDRLHPDPPALVRGRNDTPVGIDARGLQVVVDDPDIPVGYPDIRYQRHIPGIYIVSLLDRDYRITAVDSQRRMVGTETATTVFQGTERLTDAVLMVIGLTRRLLQAEDVRLILFDAGRRLLQGVLLLPIKMGGVIGYEGQRYAVLRLRRIRDDLTYRIQIIRMQQDCPQGYNRFPFLFCE